MSATIIGLISILFIFSGALIGIWLQKLLPGHHLDKNSHEIVKLGSGMIGTLTALVLGLLVSSAKTSFDTMNNGIVQGSTKIIMLDRVLAHYGPETEPIRKKLQFAVQSSLEKIWPTKVNGISGIQALDQGNANDGILGGLLALKPQTDAQRLLLSQAFQLVNDFTQTRWLMVEQTQGGIPVPFLVILIFWLTVLFVSFGMFTPRNATVVVVLFVCACSVSAAIFLELELNNPLDGVIKVSSAPLRNALKHISPE
ncbi:MAG: hypothetical protein WCH43_16025 [Verrucomicrobiota bacterium]